MNRSSNRDLRVGQIQAIPIAHSGSTNEPNSSPRSETYVFGSSNVSTLTSTSRSTSSQSLSKAEYHNLQGYQFDNTSSDFSDTAGIL